MVCFSASHLRCCSNFANVARNAALEAASSWLRSSQMRWRAASAAIACGAHARGDYKLARARRLKFEVPTAAPAAAFQTSDCGAVVKRSAFLAPR